ncbi:uncharacterized protein F4812DRAFT_447162 [Daldinia caldariorum]|uniref:uncharacterized protein n=1 Tax=Daldinia caldariorum TaxID=326644 RepID=UPI0020071FD1|nr:uncharacterized protein F4812DRAFT_447162 [Daldinia caldariorum]KAI1463275.1 hypothetical protein F4812DRAFT_447162 [Daldinia caldariorum]
MPTIRSSKSHLQNLATSDERIYTSVEQPLEKSTPLMPLSTNSIEGLQLNPLPLKLPPERQSSPMGTTKKNLPSSSPQFLFPLPPSKSADTPHSSVPPPYSSVAPSTSSSAEDFRKNTNSECMGRPINAIRRTQSTADVRGPGQWKPLPARPLECKGKQNSSRPTRPPTDDVRVSAKEGKERPSVKSQPTMNQDKNPKSSTNSASAETEDKGSRGRLMNEQILWLHRNYRGEATFLKAWGLHATRDADRERGREIIRMLMAAESTKGKEQPRDKNYQSQVDKLQHKTSPTLESGDNNDLGIIEE